MSFIIFLYFRRSAPLPVIVPRRTRRPTVRILAEIRLAANVRTGDPAELRRTPSDAIVATADAVEQASAHSAAITKSFSSSGTAVSFGARTYRRNRMELAAVLTFRIIETNRVYDRRRYTQTHTAGVMDPLAFVGTRESLPVPPQAAPYRQNNPRPLGDRKRYSIVAEYILLPRNSSSS